METKNKIILNTKKVEIKQSRIDGLGVFAKKHIQKGETVIIIKGKIIHWIVKNQKTSLAGPDWIGIAKNTWIDPRPPAKLLNHSCNPSVGIKGRVTLVALRDLKPGDEITFDYSTTEEDQLWYLRCGCKNKNCRHTVRSVQSLSPSTFKHYLPYIPYYFQKVYLGYNKMNNA